MGSVMLWAVGLFTVLGGLFAAIDTFTKNTVRQGQKGFQTRNGQVVDITSAKKRKRHADQILKIDTPQFRGYARLYGPQIVPGIPFIHRVIAPQVVARLNVTEPQVIRIKDNSSWLVKAAFRLDIAPEGVFDAAFVRPNYDDQARVVAANVVLHYLRGLNEITELDEQEVRCQLQAHLLEDGFLVTVTWFGFQELQPTHITQWADMQEVMVKRRFAALLALFRRHRGERASVPNLLIAAAAEGGTAAGLPFSATEDQGWRTEAPATEQADSSAA